METDAAAANLTDCELGHLFERALSHVDSNQAVANGPAIAITSSELRVRGPVGALREAYQRQQYVLLPDLISERLLPVVVELVRGGTFKDRKHEGIGKEACLVPGVATSLLQLLFNDPELLALVAEITGCGPLGCFDGRVYRMSGGADHYDSWHSDVGEDRQVALSVNLSARPFAGGALEIRRASMTNAEWIVENAAPGSAVLFRIGPDLRHRVSTVIGDEPRTAYAGWFRTRPDFQDLFFASLPTTR